MSRVVPFLLLVLLVLPAQAAELKLATWNIAWLTLRPAGDPTLPRDLVARDAADWRRLAEYARRLEADILAVQEVDGPEALARILPERDYAFFFAREADVQRTGFAIRRGLRAVQNPDLEGLDTAPHARFSLRRGTDVTVFPEGAPLRLLSVHLKAGCREGPIASSRGQDCEVLARQSRILADWVGERRREGIAFAILGDFNRRMDHPRDDMTAALSAEAPVLRATAGASNPCWSDARGGRPFISHILLGGGAERLVLPGSLRVMVYAERDPALRERISDHCPISVRMRLR
ncbi:endonuclease/exonuclease/phosphatase family protein [Sabulicella glaciei]|uniref:Endonuclease/exonuclease/phosphatase family protein n=1 Tax=Sabulicella glaciei TaxID=2984948 RepID=A0ABT3NXX4_9PROT|nr:endonuclease/exonuclease/phosphatase family protein [Roseococcus sp. MDT2-1-1]MCW8086975.1 endonuclease/exonuclease/phosphatase family protein [Roseococcus sp. MDT2-1-1]